MALLQLSFSSQTNSQFDLQSQGCLLPPFLWKDITEFEPMSHIHAVANRSRRSRCFGSFGPVAAPPADRNITMASEAMTVEAPAQALAWNTDVGKISLFAEKIALFGW